MNSRSQAAYEHIRQGIACGEMTPEKPLSETSLAQELQMSRTPVREAIRRLESEGLLKQRPKQGTFVRAPSRREIRELFDLRILLEPTAAARAAKRQRPQLVGRLEDLAEQMSRLLEKMEAATSPETITHLDRRYRVCDRTFHEALIPESGNRRVCKIVSDAAVLALGMGFPKCLPAELLEGYHVGNSGHAEIARAIREGDLRRAASAMRRHLVHGRHRAMTHFDELGRGPGKCRPSDCSSSRVGKSGIGER